MSRPHARSPAHGAAGRQAGRLWIVAVCLILLAPAPRGAEPVPLHRAVDAVELADTSLQAELVAAEPLVQSPVAITFDELGRMFVVEMLDYPHDRETHPGRISLLTDADDDGVFETSTVFADGLPWPSGAISYDGGLFVAASPDILFLKDHDGDGRADERRVVFTGFGTGVPEPMPDMVVNGFAMGLDHRIYGATSRNGGVVTAPGSTQAFDLRGRDFSFDPKTLRLRPESGGGQFGVTFDDYGQRFVSSNANHLLQVMYDLRYTLRNGLVEYPRAVLDIPEDGPSAPVHRISPEEDWRVMRTQWRASGKVRGLVEYGGKPSGYFTSACSVVVYRGDALPDEYDGSAFVAEPANNLVHRKTLVPDGIPMRGVKPIREAGTEFLRSASVSFRPVNFATGPDGALYVVDMHRAIVEDPKTIPTEILEGVDVRAGSALGRIYRITRKGASRGRPPALADADGPELAAAFTHPNGWVRDTAARLLFERQDVSAVPALEQLAAAATRGPVRLRALHALQGLGRLRVAHVTAALRDEDAGVREHAIRLSEAFIDEPTLRRAVLAMGDDPADRVRYQLAFTLGAFPFGDDLLGVLRTLATRGADDTWMRTAVLTTLSHPIVPILDTLTSDMAFASSPGGMALVGPMLTTIGARAQARELHSAYALLERTGDQEAQLRLARDLFAGFTRGDVDVVRVDPEQRLAALLDLARRTSMSSEAPEAVRVIAVQLLAQDPRVDHPPFLALLGPAHPNALQSAALAALRSRDDESIAAALVNRWGALTPRLRQDALAVLLGRSSRAMVLLNAIRSGQVAAADVTAGQAQSLLTHPDARVAASARALLSPETSSRQQVVDRYLPALQLTGDAQRGRTVFADVCASCHRLDDVGVDIGPNLLGVRNHGREGLLIDIFDPNRKVDPAYLHYEVETRGGDTLMGAIADESATSLTVVEAFGVRTIVQRHDITSMRAVGTSMMPEGLEASLSPQQVADLLEYLLSP